MKWGVLLAGGAGSRFWPLSTPSNPKQLLPLAGPRSTAEEAMSRLDGLIPVERLLVVTGPQLGQRLSEQLDLPAENVLIEPRPASTGPALIWASFEALRRDPEAEVLSMHADWSIGNAAAFRETAERALASARTHDRLVTVGMVPSRPETGYGYIVPGAPLGDGVSNVARFQEKPDAATALDLMAAGALWNSGLFAWTAERVLCEVRQHTPEIGPHLDRLAEADVAGFFRDVDAVSIDVGLLERSRQVAVVRGAFTWDDIGTWDALSRVRAKDGAGNVVVGPGFVHGAQDCVVWSDGIPVVLANVEDLIVVSANGRILIMPRERSADLKQVLDAMPSEIRDLP